MPDTFVADRTTGDIARASVPMTGGEAMGGGKSTWAWPVPTAVSVAFYSGAHNLVPGDTNFADDVFVRDNQGTAPCAVQFSPDGLQVVNNGGGAGTVAVTAAPGCSWTVTADAPWIHVTSATAGSGNGAISYTYDAFANPTFTRAGAIVANTAALGLRQIAHTLPPIGFWDTPEFRFVMPDVTGALALGGWALDDVGIARVRVYRDPVSGEESVADLHRRRAAGRGRAPRRRGNLPTIPLQFRRGMVVSWF